MVPTLPDEIVDREEPLVASIIDFTQANLASTWNSEGRYFEQVRVAKACELFEGFLSRVGGRVYKHPQNAFVSPAVECRSRLGSPPGMKGRSCYHQQSK
jgi:hypothetical protein